MLLYWGKLNDCRSYGITNGDTLFAGLYMAGALRPPESFEDLNEAENQSAYYAQTNVDTKTRIPQVANMISSI